MQTKNKELICNKCQRIIPNKEWFTGNGCIWCDNNYWTKKIIENKK